MAISDVRDDEFYQLLPEKENTVNHKKSNQNVAFRREGKTGVFRAKPSQKTEKEPTYIILLRPKVWI